ncbi:hypothetical protein FA09DRAFT_332180 [Tilletiopsis washingtonensis]|uniref:Secreted protein n=1 Tax=Tilletiopsis washingtonensis TaxID=58919 RepID=A0A316Z0I1_9BASI|nr:hypothetical protein FA09DRAFT_332180 [Tilletiopsis washingtonensis]PWN95247.1 hypothetical protein FA09DRAFT_332180 [Tilletiopsis washingtonensis]
MLWTILLIAAAGSLQPSFSACASALRGITSPAALHSPMTPAAECMASLGLVDVPSQLRTLRPKHRGGRGLRGCVF